MPIRRMGQAGLQADLSVMELLWVGAHNTSRNQVPSTNVQKLDVPGPDEKFCLCWLCAFTKFSSRGAIFPVHLIFEHL